MSPQVGDIWEYKKSDGTQSMTMLLIEQLPRTTRKSKTFKIISFNCNTQIIYFHPNDEPCWKKLA